MAFDTAYSQIKKSKEEILQELKLSLEKNNAVGIFIRDTRELITTTVRNIEDQPDGDCKVMLHHQDLHGYPIERTALKLSNIEKVIHFNIDYNDPDYVKVRRKEKFKA